MHAETHRTALVGSIICTVAKEFFRGGSSKADQHLEKKIYKKIDFCSNIHIIIALNHAQGKNEISTDSYSYDKYTISRYGKVGVIYRVMFYKASLMLPPSVNTFTSHCKKHRLTESLHLARYHKISLKRNDSLNPPPNSFIRLTSRRNDPSEVTLFLQFGCIASVSTSQTTAYLRTTLEPRQ